MGEHLRYILKSFSWGLISKIIDAGVKLVIVPLLLGYFGKDDYGLIVLALSINAYLQLLDLGMNTGAVKYFSGWITQEKFEILHQVARTSISFYGIVGLINAFVLLFISYTGVSYFALSPEQLEIMRKLLYILSILAIVNWSASVFNQLLVAHHMITIVQQIMVIRSILSLALVYITIYFNLSLVNYFLWLTIISSLQVIPFAIIAKKNNLIDRFIPGINWKLFQPVMKYSLAIISIGIFSMTAMKMRPVILSIYGHEGIGIVTDYRVMEMITLFVISIGGMLINIFLPISSKIVLKNDVHQMSEFAQKTTYFTSIISVLLCFPIIINSREILIAYVGQEYAELSNWLIMWMFIILAYLHNSPVSSLVLATGKTRMLILSSGIACVLSLILNAVLCKVYGVGSAVIGYGLYILIQMSFYYLYLNSKVLNLNSKAIFISFIIPVSNALIALFLSGRINWVLENIYLNIVLKSAQWGMIFLILLYLTNKIEGKKRITLKVNIIK